MASTQSLIRNFDDLVRCSSVLTEGIEGGKFDERFEKENHARVGGLL